MADHDGHTVNVGPVTIGEPLPVADPIDIDATVVSLLRSYGPNERDINVICNEVDRLRSENEHLRVALINCDQQRKEYQRRLDAISRNLDGFDLEADRG